MRQQARYLLIVAAAVVAAPSAHAQPAGMPNLRAVSGKPLPDPGMPPGTVSVRVARKIPANAAADVEITALIKNAGGDLRKRTAKTDASGRALFEGIAPGDEFHAEVTVDGEKLATDTFPMPASGGVRMMLIAGLGAAGAPTDEGEGAAAEGGGAGQGGDFSLGISTGTTRADASLPVKTLEVALVDEQGQPIADHEVMLGSVERGGHLDVHRARSDAKGVARFTGLATGAGIGYAAVLDWHGVRIGTEPFSMPESGGMRAEIHAPARTSDPSTITIGNGGRVILEMHEDQLQVMELLPLENSSDKLFDPGPGAVEIPLPKESVGAQSLQQNDRRLEIRQNRGVAVHGAISPKGAAAGPGADPRSAGNEVAFAFGMPYHGDTRDFEQPLPNGAGQLAIIVEQSSGVRVTGPRVGQPEARELQGHKYWLMRVEPIPAGGVLAFTITGLPSTSSVGRWVSLGLALALVLGALLFAHRPKDEARRAAEGERERLTSQRENLFAELVAVERSARGDAAARKKELVARLESIYQQLAVLDEQRAA
jgi:hypothetical protein